MSDMVKNLAQITMGLLISCIISYGFVIAHPLCSGTISDRCKSTLNKIKTDATPSIKCRASVSHNCERTQPSIIISKLSPNKVNAKTSCCEYEPCDGFHLTTCNNYSSQQPSIFRALEYDSFRKKKALKNSLNQQSPSIPRHPTSIYILTRTIIC